MSSLIQRRAAHGGKKTHYLDGGTSLSLANDIFGFDGWRSQIVSSELEYAREKQKNSDRWFIGVSVIVRVELKNGSYHEDIGFGEAINIKGRGQALQKAKKEAVTDATKRALRVFGNGLGNCLRKDWYLELLKKGDTFEDLQLETYRNPHLTGPRGVAKVKKRDMLSEEKAPIILEIPKVRENTSKHVVPIPKSKFSKPDATEVSAKPDKSIVKVPEIPPFKPIIGEKLKPKFSSRCVSSELPKNIPSKPTPAHVEVNDTHRFGQAPVDPKAPLKVDAQSISRDRMLPSSRPPRFISMGPPGCVVALPSLQNPSQSPPSSFSLQSSDKFGNDEDIIHRFGSRKRGMSELQLIGKRSPKKPRFGKKSMVPLL